MGIGDRIMQASVYAAVLALAACGDSQAVPADATPQDASPAEIDAEDIIVDSFCFEGTYCEDGVAFQELSWSTGDSCRGESVECAEGCEPAPVFEGVVFESFERLCAETPTARLGDPCDEAIDCFPVRAELVDGSYQTEHLRCDEALGECVLIDAPVYEEFLSPCLTAGGFPEVGSVGVEVRPGRHECQFGHCFFSRLPNDPCIKNGCVPRCTTDLDCPQGSRCEQNLDTTSTLYSGGVCVFDEPGSFDTFDCWECACDRVPGRCDAESDGSFTPCPCDPDCDVSNACAQDGSCDNFCDPDDNCGDRDCFEMIGGSVCFGGSG